MIDSKKRDYSQMSLNFIVSLFLQQNCLPHFVLLQLFNEFTLVRGEVEGSHDGSPRWPTAEIKTFLTNKLRVIQSYNKIF